MTKFGTIISGAAALALTSGCTTTDPYASGEILGTAALTFADGASAGTATLIADGDVVRLTLAATGLSDGERGFHLHTTGTCAAPGFTSAGGHLNPSGEGHGLEDDDGSHLGDLPNLVSDGSAVTNATVILRGSRAYLMKQIFDQDGTAIVIHADPDDGTSEPSGNAGKRIACGVINRG